MHQVRWGALSTASIGMKQVIPAMQKAAHVQVTAIASRNENGARDAACTLGLEKFYGSYEALLADPDIDAVYIPLPNHLHLPWSLKALEAGKHVLCEKPIGLSSQEAETLLAASQGYPSLKIMEAFMYRHHPQWVRARELIETGEIGSLTSIQVYFSYFNNDPNNIRNRTDVGGGAMMDIGCYCTSLSRWLFQAEPDRVFGFVDRDPAFGTDRLFSGMMDFDGRIASFTCSTQLEWHQRVILCGEAGSIELMIPFNSPIDRPTVLVHRQGKQARTIEFEVCDQYAIQGELMSLAILNDTPVPTPLTDAVGNMRVMETLLRAAETQTWTKC